MQRLFLACLVSFAASPLLAQSPDSSVYVYLGTLAQRTPAELTELTASEDLIRRGYAYLQLHIASKDPGQAANAVRTFVNAVRSDADDAWAHLGIALTLQRAPKTMALLKTLGYSEGEAKKVAARELDRALELEPKITENEAVIAALYPGDNLRAEKTSIDTAAVLARLPVSALEFHQRAAILFARGDDKGGAQAYFAGVERWDSTSAEVYMAEALAIATPQESISITDGDFTKRREKLALFWRKRSVRDGVSIEERLGEHYRRIAYARRHFAMETQNHIGRNIWGKLRTGMEKQVDDRGLIYIRHGEPFDQLRTAVRERGFQGEDMTPEAWVYREPDGTYRIYYFIGGRAESDPLRGTSPNSAGDRLSALAGLEKYDARYAFLAARLDGIRLAEWSQRNLGGGSNAQSRVALMKDDFMWAREHAAERNFDMLFAGFDYDAARPRFKKTFDVFQDFATFRGKGCTDVVYSVATPVSPYRLSLAVADTFVWETLTVDTVIEQPLLPGEYARASGVLCATPDHNAFLRVTASQDAETGQSTGGDLIVPDYRGRELMMSDLLFATTDDGPFVRGRARLAIVPPRQFRQGEAFRVFYELYNLPVNHTYRTEITFTTVEPNVIARVLKGRKSTTVTFEETSLTNDLVQELRTLVPDIEPGRVEVSIKVTDLASRQSATKSETIWITAPPKD